MSSVVWLLQFLERCDMSWPCRFLTIHPRNGTHTKHGTMLSLTTLLTVRFRELSCLLRCAKATCQLRRPPQHTKDAIAAPLFGRHSGLSHASLLLSMDDALSSYVLRLFAFLTCLFSVSAPIPLVVPCGCTLGCTLKRLLLLASSSQ